MWRWIAFVAVAFSLFVKSDCLTIEDGILINRCGLWQRYSGLPIRISVNKQSPEQEIVVYRDWVKYVVVPKENSAPPQDGMVIVPSNRIISSASSFVGYSVSAITSVSFDFGNRR